MIKSITLCKKYQCILPFRHLVTKKIGREKMIFRDMERATGLFRDIFIEKRDI